MFDFIYKKLYILGLYTARYLKRFFKATARIFGKPLKALGAFAFAGVVYIKQYFSQRTDDARELVDDVKKANLKMLGIDEKASEKKGTKGLAEYIKHAFSKHGIALTVVTELVAPLVSLVILIATINYFGTRNLALKITYNNMDIGCVDSESVYLEAHNKAQTRLRTAKVTGEGTAELKAAEYSIVNAKPTDLKDADAICNKLIERSANNITNACGIYIDGEFLCAVKNETDAQTVFDNILSSYGSEEKEDEKEENEEAQEVDNTQSNEADEADGKSKPSQENAQQDEEEILESDSNNKNENEAEASQEKNDEAEAEEDKEEPEKEDSGSTLGFAEEIQYIQGLYPDDKNTILDAAQLSQKLTNNQKEAVYYVAHKGDTFAGVAGQYNVSVSELRELNPNLSAYLNDGDKVLISKAQDLVRIQVTRTETRTVELAYETIEVETSSLYKGIKKTVNEGKNGEQEITELVTYINGERVSVKEVSRVTTVEPVAKKVQVGTKKNPYGTATSYGGRFLWPSIGAYSISSYYGYRSMGWHGGIDIVKPGGHSTGTTIVAAGDGVVVSASYHYSWGCNIVINHGNGLSTRYAHMIPGSFKVSPGQRVYAGQAIGSIGSSGNVTGPHLHFEVMVNGNRVDPLPYLGR